MMTELVKLGGSLQWNENHGDGVKENRLMQLKPFNERSDPTCSARCTLLQCCPFHAAWCECILLVLRQDPAFTV